MRKVVLWAGLEEYWLVPRSSGFSGLIFMDRMCRRGPRNLNHVMWDVAKES